MINKIVFCIALFITSIVNGQEKDYLIQFSDSSEEISGYKDTHGNIVFPLKFQSALMRADTFHNIIAVSERTNKALKMYYLLRDGREIGVDSTYMSDFTFDCECEEKIRFSERKHGRVGFLDKNGKVIIPALYNAATPFYNGIAMALQGARKECWGGTKEDTTDCEHWSWKGGDCMLINDKNEILVDSLDGNSMRNINWYSLQKNNRAVDTSLYITLKGTNGNTYSFLDYDKEFKKWFYNAFMKSLATANMDTIRKYCFSKITYWDKKIGWVSQANDSFLHRYPNAITLKRFTEDSLKKMSIMNDHFNFMLYSEDNVIYKAFYNSCREHLEEKYPVFSVNFEYYNKRNKKLPPQKRKYEEGYMSEFDRENVLNASKQDVFDFIRTDDGYKLLSVSIKK